MRKKVKYIIFENNGVETPIVFPDTLAHVDMAQGREIVSAGFVDFYRVGDFVAVGCYGESVSLKVASRKQKDEAVILKEFNLEEDEL